jgi:uncharacterized protein YdhG (YjbR/CyaY superfamily)
MKKNAKGTDKPGTSKPKTVDEYFAAVPEPAYSTSNKVRGVIRAAMPGDCTEVISYGIPTFKYQGQSVVAIAAFTKHCSLFPMGSSAIARFKNELKGYQTSKGTIQFPIDKPLPSTLVKKIVKARIAQNEAKNAAKKGRSKAGKDV